MLTPAGCERRRQRLLERMQKEGWPAFVSGNYRTVYYFTGALHAADSLSIFLMKDDGVGAVYDSPSRLPAGLTRCAVERATTPGIVEAVLPANIIDATPAMLALRKRKEEDEIDEVRAALKLCAAAYDAARATIRAGVTEIDVFNAMQSAVVRTAGTSVALIGDFACGERAIRGGGPPTMREVAAGDLYVLDLFPAPSLYFGDVCRTFAAGEPSDLQHRAWEIVCEAVRIGEAAVKPGVPARDVYALIKNFLDSHELTENSFWHHAGHGIGYQVGHEAPRIIPSSHDVFEVGDVITLEPGVYTKALRGGIRLEDNYVVRESGLENLFSYPKQLHP